MFNLLVSVIGLSVLGASSTAIPDPFKDPEIVAIHDLHTRAEQGDKAATKELIVVLEASCRSHPENALLQAYLGSAYTLASRDAFPGPAKLNYLKEGLKTMDAAVERAPNQPAVRFIRAVNNLHLPAFINRRDDARADFTILVEQLRQGDHGLSAATRQAIFYYAGLSFKQMRQNGAARAAWKEGLALEPDSEMATKISDELKRLKV
ncbi:MAG: hypothetical protein OHK005_16680 [Candidatus Methylacidiphilales bacterium]